MKKNYFKKSLSLILTVLMLMSCWVFVPGEHQIEAEAIASNVRGIPAIKGSHYAGSTGSYGTPLFDGTLNRWFKFHNKGVDYVKISYPSEIYVDVSETLQSAGYFFNVDWVFGKSSDYRILIGANALGHNSFWSGKPEKYYTMTNIFADYGFDASVPTGGRKIVYNSNTGGTDYDLRIVGFNHSTQGTDGFNYPDNNMRHEKYVLFRSYSADTNTATIYLMGKPNSSYVGKRSEYNTSGDSFASYGVQQNYNSGWGNNNNTMFLQKNYGASNDDCSSYYEGQWAEMQWFVTVYDKSALNTLINSAKDRINNNTAAYSPAYIDKLTKAVSTAEAALKKRATNQTEIDNAKATLQSVYDDVEYRIYELAYENMFYFADWYNSDSAKTNDGYVTKDVNAGTIKIYSANGANENTTASSYPGNHSDSMYSIPVIPGKDITVEYTATSEVAVNSEVFLFWYDSSNNPVNNVEGTNILNQKEFGSNGTYRVTFTVPNGASKAEIRFDNNNKKTASTVTFSNIAVYYADRAAEIGLESWADRPYRKVYNYGDTTAASAGLDQPVRKGYSFNGWSTAVNGSVYTASTMTSSKTLYSSWTGRTLDIGYNNLFSFSDWYYSKSNDVNYTSRGSLTADINAGTIKFEAYINDFYTVNNGAEGFYTADVEPNTTYILDYDLETNKCGIQVGTWYFNDALTELSYDISYDKKDSFEFTTPANCTKVAFRFGSTGEDGYVTYSNIILAKKADYDAYVKNYSKVRETFVVGETKALNYTPTREGYAFDGWYKDGEKLTSTAGLNESDIVYAQWVKTWTVTFVNYDGTVLGTATVKNGETATTPAATPTRKTDDSYKYTFSGWTDYSNITADRTVTAQFKETAHGNFILSFASDATCTSNAKVFKYCGKCSYYLGESVYNPAEDENAAEHTDWLAKGHDFSGGNILDGSSTGNTDTDTHSIKCSRYNKCGETKAVGHEWEKRSTGGATCTDPGTINWICTCGEKKTTAGEINSDAHKYIETEGTPNNNGETHTVKCEYNPEHTKSVACTDANDDCKCDICEQELIHVYDQKTETEDYQKTPADCLNDAVYYYTCKCGAQGTETWTKTGSKLGHNWTNTEKYLKTAAACESDAVYYKECSRTGCGISSETETGSTWTKADSATGHDYTSETIRNNENGTHSYLCANNCGTYGYNKVKENSKACAYGDWDTTGAKEHSKTCEECSYVFTQDHNFTGWTTVAGATDKAEASHTHKCEICDKVETEDCNYDKGVPTKETCLDAGYTTYTCQDCNHQYKTPGADATGHNYTGDYKYNTTTDKHQRLCANGCGTYGIGDVEDAEEACNWTYNNTKTGEHEAKCACGNKQTETCSGGTATCTAPAECEFCGEAYGLTSDHSFTGDAVVLVGDVHAYLCEYCGTTSGFNGVVGDKEGCSGGTATCTDKAVCEVCGDEHGEINANNHDWSDWANVEGTETHKRVCDYNPAHIEEGDCFSADPSVIAPDCEAKGYILNVCDFCEYEWKVYNAEPLGHDWGAWVKNNDGTHTRTCKDTTCKYGEDGKAKTETANCTKENADAVVTAPTCLDAGYTTYTCKDCGYEWTDDATEATGHSYTTKKEVESDAYKRTDKDCVTDLTYWYCCDNCDVSAATEAELDKYKDTTLYFVADEAEGHEFNLSVVDEKYLKSAATCTDRAVYYKSCTCGASSNDDTLVFSSGSVRSHDWKDTTKYLKTPADCVNDAVYYKECKYEDCGISSAGVTNATWTKSDSALKHDFDKDDNGIIGDDKAYVAKVDATCTTSGKLEHYICQTCGKMYADKDGTTELTKVVVDALKHDFETIKERPVTCEENGYTTHKICKREGCNYVDPDKKEFKASGHNFTGGYFYDSINNYHARYCVNEKCLFARDINGEIEVDENGKYVYVKAYGLGSGENAVKYDVIYDLDDATVVGGERCSFDNFLTSTVNGEHSHDAACVCGNRTIRVIGSDKITTQVVEPTCYRSGYTLNTCTEGTCTDTWRTDLKDQLEHDLSGDATSNGDGTHSVKCARGCGYATAKVDCSTETPATACGTKSVCDVCNGEFGEEVAHKFTNYVEDKDSATCTEDGTETAVCDTCKVATHTVTVEGSRLDHDWLAEYTNTVKGWMFKPDDFDVEIKDATCCEEGTLINYCTRCSEYKLKYEKADASKHVWPTKANGEKDWKFVSGDCSTGVVYSIICDVCQTKDTMVDTNVSHEWKVIRVHEANCMDDGFVEFACDVCEIVEVFDNKSEDWDKAESEFAVLAKDYNIRATKKHTWQLDGDEYFVYIDKYATYDEEGKGHYLCTKCSATEDVVLPATFNPENHKDHYHPELGEHGVNTLKTIAYVAPTCTTSGNLEYVKCTRCSYSAYDMDRDAYYLPALGHTEPNDIGECERCERKIVKEDISADCGCVCHKDNAFMQFIYKLISVFWKIFGINSSCECGSVHYKK